MGYFGGFSMQVEVFRCQCAPCLYCAPHYLSPPLLCFPVTRAVWASAADHNDDRFTYDYYRLRVVGLIVAAVLCVIGVIILLAGKCRCKFNQNKRTRSNSGLHSPAPPPAW
ncbi:phospholemman-like [Chiloscyllium punctatum]|uniref:phospholemman-like n=1 Tax=Chiloscyllium punctatum TaxID=137246 RepID=UPI003B63E0CC